MLLSHKLVAITVLTLVGLGSYKLMGPGQGNSEFDQCLDTFPQSTRDLWLSPAYRDRLNQKRQDFQDERHRRAALTRFYSQNPQLRAPRLPPLCPNFDLGVDGQLFKTAAQDVQLFCDPDHDSVRNNTDTLFGFHTGFSNFCHDQSGRQTTADILWPGDDAKLQAYRTLYRMDPPKADFYAHSPNNLYGSTGPIAASSWEAQGLEIGFKRWAAAPGVLFPVVIFSVGYGVPSSAYWRTVMDYVHQGYIVVIIRQVINDNDSSDFKRGMFYRGLDHDTIMGWLLAINATGSGHPLEGCITLDGLILGGHSDGGSGSVNKVSRVGNPLYEVTFNPRFANAILILEEPAVWEDPSWVMSNVSNPAFIYTGGNTYGDLGVLRLQHLNQSPLTYVAFVPLADHRSWPTDYLRCSKLAIATGDVVDAGFWSFPGVSAAAISLNESKGTGWPEKTIFFIQKWNRRASSMMAYPGFNTMWLMLFHLPNAYPEMEEDNAILIAGKDGDTDWEQAKSAAALEIQWNRQTSSGGPLTFWIDFAYLSISSSSSSYPSFNPLFVFMDGNFKFWKTLPPPLDLVVANWDPIFS